MPISPSFTIFPDPYESGKALTLEYDDLAFPSHVFFSATPPSSAVGALIPHGATKWLRLINTFGAVVMPAEFVAARIANKETYIGVVSDDKLAETVVWWEHLETMDNPVAPPPHAPYDPKKYWGSVMSVTTDAANALNTIRVNQISGSAFSLYREDPVFGRTFLRASDRVKLGDATDPKRLLTLVEDGEVPLDTPVTYCLIEYLPKKPSERPATQINLIKNPSFEVSVTDGGWEWASIGRSAKLVSAVQKANIQGDWTVNPTITEGTLDTTSSLNNVTVTSTSDAPTLLTSDYIPVIAGERYEVDISIVAALSTRDARLITTFYGAPDATHPDGVPLGTHQSAAISLQAQRSDQVLINNFFVPPGTLKARFELSSYDDGRATSAAGEMFSIAKTFVLVDQGAQERFAGSNAAEITGTSALHTISAPAGTVDSAGKVISNFYPMLNIPTPDGGIKPNTQYRLTGNVIVWDNPTNTVPVSWHISRHFFNTWADDRAKTVTWADVRNMSYAVSDCADVYIVCYDNAGQVLKAQFVGEADAVHWLSFKEMVIPPAGTVKIGLVQGEHNQDGSDTRSLVWHADAFMLEHELFNQWQLDYLDGDVKVSANTNLKGTVATESDLPKYGIEIGDIYLVKTATNTAQNGHAFVWDGAAWHHQGPYRGSTISTMEGTNPQFSQPGWQVLWLDPSKPHNSVSIIVPPQNLRTCIGPVTINSAIAVSQTHINCSPAATVHLTDPLLPRMNIWAMFATLGAWEHPARVERHAVVNRYTPVPVNDMRQSMLNTITLITKTHEQRLRMRRILQSGRTLLLQFPRTKDWGDIAMYISIDNVSEGFIGEDLSRSERKWELPFQVVSRPLGYLPSSTYITWDRIRTATSTSFWRNWDELMLHRATWFDLYTNDLLDSNDLGSSPISGGQFVADTTVGVTIPRLDVTPGGPPPPPAVP